MRKHEWKELPRDEGRRERVCESCGLGDVRDRNGTWSVKTPCIEPVPERVSYEALIAELAAHPVEVELSYGVRRLQTFEQQIRCEGVPGKWKVGLTGAKTLFVFSSPLDSGFWTPEFAELELGFARLLRDLRARGYDPYKHSEYYGRVQSARYRDFHPED